MLHLPELEALYVAMTPFARGLLLEMAREYRKAWPAPKKSPLLTVVEKGGPVEGLARNLDRKLNSFPMVLIGQSVDG